MHIALVTRLSAQTTGEVPPGTSGASSVAVDGRMYVTCGHTEEGNTNETYYLDIVSRTWKWVDTGDAHLSPSPRDKFCAWLHSDK